MSGFETFRSQRYVPTNQFQNLSEIETTKLQKKLLTLIIRAKPLYCHADPDFNNVAKNRLEWVIIAEKCRSTVPECINLWYSLLRTYFSLANGNNWQHKELFERMEPFLSHHELQKPTEEQKLFVLNVLEASQYSDDALTYMNGIWLQITTQCNAIVPGVIMSSLNWKKYWLSLRQQLATKLSTGKESSLNEEQLRILNICGVDMSASISEIIKVLVKNGEQNPGKTVKVSFKCKRCSEVKDDVTLNGICASCYMKSNLCNICAKEIFNTQYDISNWSKQALNLLPKAFNLNSRAKGSGNRTTVLVCTNCSEELKRRAKWVWEMCRICLTKQTHPHNMNYLFSNKFKDLRTNIADYLNVEFKANDALPGLICKNCVTQLENLCQYIKLFHQNQNELLRIHAKHFIGDIGEGQSLKASKTKCPSLQLVIKDVFSMNQNEQEVNVSQVPSLRFENKGTEIHAEKKTCPRPQTNLQSPLQTTKPAVFTIIDRVGPLPSPAGPVSTVSTVPLPIKREPDEIIDLVSDFMPKMIKTEPIKDVTEILEPLSAIPIAISSAEVAVQSTIKVVKINGVTTAVKLHPYIPGVYIPVNPPGLKNGVPMTLEEPLLQNIQMNLESEANLPATNQEESQESYFPSSVFNIKREAVEEILCEPTLTLPVENPSPTASSRFKLRDFQIKLNREKVCERNAS